MNNQIHEVKLMILILVYYCKTHWANLIILYHILLSVGVLQDNKEQMLDEASSAEKECLIQETSVELISDTTQQRLGALTLNAQGRQGWLDTGETHWGGTDKHKGGKPDKDRSQVNKRRHFKIKQEIIETSQSHEIQTTLSTWSLNIRVISTVLYRGLS